MKLEAFRIVQVLLSVLGSSLSLVETVYLLKSAANARRLLEAIASLQLKIICQYLFTASVNFSCVICPHALSPVTKTTGLQ